MVREENRRARRIGAVGEFTELEWLRLCLEYSYACGYCGAWTKLTVDHRIPLERGGSNWIDNIIPACASCNFQKNTMTEEEFRRRRGLHEDWAPYEVGRAA